MLLVIFLKTTRSYKMKYNIFIGTMLKHFSMDAKWHLFAMSHSKSACGGTVGTIKMLARKFSLKIPYRSRSLYWGNITSQLL
jgi:hypothetical protein